MKGYCVECRSRTSATVIDDGIGPNEYGGAPGFDSRKWAASICCEAPVYHDAEFQRPVTADEALDEIDLERKIEAREAAMHFVEAALDGREYHEALGAWRNK